MKQHIQEYCKERIKKKKTGNIDVTYSELLWQASGENENRQMEIQTEELSNFQRLLEELVRENILKPVGRSKKDGFAEHVYGKYRIIGNVSKKETDKDHILLLHSYIGAKVFESYHLKKAEFEKDREAIDVIYRYYKQQQKEWMTSNELAYYLFGDEKAFEQTENEQKKKKRKEEVGKYTHVLKNMGLDMEKDLHAYYTKEPFFCQMRRSFLRRKAAES